MNLELHHNYVYLVSITNLTVDKKARRVTFHVLGKGMPSFTDHRLPYSVHIYKNGAKVSSEVIVISNIRIASDGMTVNADIVPRKWMFQVECKQVSGGYMIIPRVLVAPPGTYGTWGAPHQEWDQTKTHFLEEMKLVHEDGDIYRYEEAEYGDIDSLSKALNQPG